MTMKTRVEKIKPMKHEEWANGYIQEVVREIEKTQKKLNELIGMVNHLVITNHLHN